MENEYEVNPNQLCLFCNQSECGCHFYDDRFLEQVKIAEEVLAELIAEECQ